MQGGYECEKYSEGNFNHKYYMAAIFAFHNDYTNQSVPEPIRVELCHGALVNENWIVTSGLFDIN